MTLFSSSVFSEHSLVLAHNIGGVFSLWETGPGSV